MEELPTLRSLARDTCMELYQSHGCRGCLRDSVLWNTDESTNTDGMAHGLAPWTPLFLGKQVV